MAETYDEQIPPTVIGTPRPRRPRLSNLAMPSSFSFSPGPCAREIAIGGFVLPQFDKSRAHLCRTSSLWR